MLANPFEHRTSLAISELSPQLQAEAKRLLADPSLVAEWHDWLDRHPEVESISFSGDVFGNLKQDRRKKVVWLM
jgi:SAM-dependent MidA family methyltransferase